MCKMVRICLVKSPNSFCRLCFCTSVFLPLRPLAALCNIVVSQVACGSRHSVALTQGTVKSTVTKAQAVYTAVDMFVCDSLFFRLKKETFQC